MILFLRDLVKKAVIVILVVLFFLSSSYAQFSFQVFPVGANGDPFSDTLLNTRNILLAAGIKQVNAYQTLAEVTKTFESKIVNLNKNGRVEKITACFAKSKVSNFTLCIYDTIVYDNSGHMLGINTTDNKGNGYPPFVSTLR